MQLFEDGDKTFVVDEFFFVGEFFTGTDFFEDVVKAGEREAKCIKRSCPAIDPPRQAGATRFESASRTASAGLSAVSIPANGQHRDVGPQIVCPKRCSSTTPAS